MNRDWRWTKTAAITLALLAGRVPASPAEIELALAGTYETGIFDDGAAEISAYDPDSKRLFVTNAGGNRLDVLDISNPSAPLLAQQIDLSPYGAGPNSVAAARGVVAVAVEADPKQDPGRVVFLAAADGSYIDQVEVGALPDMLTFTHDGRTVLVANEGEPNDDYTVDPEGSISIIDLRRLGSLDAGDVATAGFGHLTPADLPAGVRIYGPGASVAQDLEPEYIAVSKNGRTAWVTLQENNALAVIDVRRAEVMAVLPLGVKNHALAANALDPSNRDSGIEIAPWPVWGLYQPDAVALFKAGGDDYLILANEGDARDYDGYSEEERVKDLALDPVAFPDAATLQLDENLGRLNSTLASGDVDGDGDFDQIFAYGARSFSIRRLDGSLVYDSGSLLEEITAAALPADFNSTNDENGSFDSRSDDKGPEPEGVTTGRIGGRVYGFVGLERIGGIMVFDLSRPEAPEFVQYINPRDFSGDAEAGTAGDLGPEGLLFIPKADSPIHRPLLAVTNEISGSTSLYRIDRVDDEDSDSDSDSDSDD